MDRKNYFLLPGGCKKEGRSSCRDRSLGKEIVQAAASFSGGEIPR